MKKFLSVILSCLMVLSMVSVASFADETAGQLEGEGTAENPFVIKSADDLIDMSNLIEQDAAYADDYYVLANDIDCTGASITPIGELKCSPSSLSLENTGLNGLHKCVFCSLSVAYCPDFSCLLYFGSPVYTNTYV